MTRSSPHHIKQPKWLFAKQDNLWDLDLDIHFWPFTKNACLRCGLFSSCNAIVELIHIPIDTIWCRAKIKKPPPPPFSVSLSVLNYCYFVLILFPSAQCVKLQYAIALKNWHVSECSYWYMFSYIGGSR